jgi:hypothetical protein
MPRRSVVASGRLYPFGIVSLTLVDAQDHIAPLASAVHEAVGLDDVGEVVGPVDHLPVLAFLREAHEVCDVVGRVCKLEAAGDPCAE